MKRILGLILLLTCALGLCAAILGVRDPAFLGGQSAAAAVPTDWSQRVVANGGEIPSQNTIAAMETLRTSLISLGLTNKIYNLCVFVPDNVTACFTPLFYHKGWSFWTNTFVSGDLNVNGIKGDGSTKMADTGAKAKVGEAVGISNNCGLSVIVSELARGTNFFANNSQAMLGYSDNNFDPQFVLSVNNGGNTFWGAGPTASSANYINTNDFCRVGYLSGNRDSNGVLNVYVASPGESHKLLATKTISLVTNTVTENTITAFTLRRGITNAAVTFTTNRLSMACIHNGFTETESSNFWWAVKTCRETLGGGNGDPVHDWAVRVTDAGGSAISTTTSNALQTFWQGLDTDGLLYKMVSVNCVVPDNLTAARTPLIWQGGHPVWRNFFFNSTNLTVNGLVGDGTSKYMGTGITNNTTTSIHAGFLTDNSGGITLVSTTATGSSSLGGTTGAASTHFTLRTDSSNCIFWCWHWNAVPEAVSQVSPISFGYISGNRTAVNSLALYAASQTYPHTLQTNNTATRTGTRFAGEMLAWAEAANTSSAPSVFSANRLSFLAVHAGLTQTESSNLWIRVKDLRTALGGGVP